MQIKNVRFIIAAITTFSAYAVYVSRVNLSDLSFSGNIARCLLTNHLANFSTYLSIAIIAMVDDHHGNNDQQQQESSAKVVQSPLQSGNNSNELFHDAKLYSSPIDNQQLSPMKNNTSAILLPAATTNSNSSATTSRSLANIFVKSRDSLKTPLISQEKFHWDSTEQGHILGAFFYGYILFQIPGARMAETVGARWIIMAASAGSAVISLAFPLSTQLNSIYLLMMLRFVMGLCQSAFFPAAYCLFCRWLPERERSVLLPIMFIGSNMGSISTYIMSSYLISSSYGWPSVFHLSGWVCLLCSLLWAIFGSNGPEDNWWISDEEKKMIQSNVNNQSSESNSLQADEDEPTADINNQVINQQDENNNNNEQRLTTKAATHGNSSSETKQTVREVTPDPSWSKLICSIPVWTLILSMYGNEWSNVVLCYQLPTYLNAALNYPIEQNGVINSFFQLSYTVASPIMSSLGAYMLDNHVFGMRKVHVRKLFQSLATFGQLVCFVSVPICGANRGLIILFMFLAIVFKACANAGDIMVSGDLSPEYAGTIFAFANSIGNTAGFFVPLLAAAFVGDTHDRVHWTPFWLTTASIMCFSGVIFLVFGETRRQDFSKDPDELDDGRQTIDLTLLKIRSDIGHHHHHHHQVHPQKLQTHQTKTKTTSFN